MEPRLDFTQSNPAAIQAVMGLEKALSKSTLEKPLTELVRLRASQINGCAYCVDLHTADARKGGEDNRRLATVSVWHETPFFTDRERAALAWTDALTRVAEGANHEAAYADLDAHFTQEEQVKLTLLISIINGWNRIAIGFGMWVEMPIKAAA